MTASAARTFSRVLSSPSKVANSLEWKKGSGNVLSVNVNKDSIDLAVASHPSYGEPIQSLPRIPLQLETESNRKVLSSGVVVEIQDIVSKYDVCGFVVSWPVEKEGWCGAPCGRVMHVMDQLSVHPKIMNGASRPACLWDGEHRAADVDEFGRDPVYSATPDTDKTVHVASQEQYGDHHCTASQIWNDFCKQHWPELYQGELAPGRRLEGDFDVETMHQEREGDFDVETMHQERDEEGGPIYSVPSTVAATRKRAAGGRMMASKVDWLDAYESGSRKEDILL